MAQLRQPTVIITITTTTDVFVLPCGATHTLISDRKVLWDKSGGSGRVNPNYLHPHFKGYLI